MPASRDGSTTQSTENPSGGGLSTTRSQAINISNGQQISNHSSSGGFENWSNAVPQVTGYVYNNGMANQEPYHYYQPINTGHYGIDPSNTWSPFPTNYNQGPLNSPPGNPYASQMPAQMFNSDLNYGLPTYNVFGGEYGQGGWSPSIVPQQQHPDIRGGGAGGKQGGGAQQDPYYGGRSAYLPTGVDSYSREMDHRMGAMNLGNSNHVVSGGQFIDHHSSMGSYGGGGGHSVVSHHVPVSNKPLTWADKVKMAPKENAPRKERPKIGAVNSGGNGGNSTRGGSVWSSASANVTARSAPVKSHSPTGNGWTTGGQTATVTARKPPTVSAVAAAAANNGVTGVSLGSGPAGDGPQVNGTGASTEKATERASDDCDLLDPMLKKLKKETNPAVFNLPLQGARFFVIKSYSEDDVHRSIKYGIWCSTEHGNKRLDQAFKEREGKGPIYLFFSVNASGHFCGVAQMVSAVDYSKQSGVWAQDKWKGLFKVKWLYVKDVPNNQLRHIRLENNENKPVTNSRDTQEVHWEKGRGVLKVVHGFKHTTSLFDDFSHYEKRQLEENQRKKAGDSD